MNEFFTSKNGEKLAKALITVLGLLAIFLVFEVISVARSWDTPDIATNTISVSGTGTATTTPDIAQFSFSVSADAKVVSDAQSTVTTKTNAILADLKNLGIEDKDIQTSGYSVYPKYSYSSGICTMNGPCGPSTQTQDGYTVSESITVKVRKIDNAGEALGIAGKDGATDISSLSLTLDNPEAPLTDARAKAIADAEGKAKMLAKQLGVKLVRITSFSESTDGGIRPIYATFDKAASSGVASSPTIPTGENTSTDNVTITYEIR